MIWLCIFTTLWFLTAFAPITKATNTKYESTGSFDVRKVLEASSVPHVDTRVDSRLWCAALAARKDSKLFWQRKEDDGTRRCVALHRDFEDFNALRGDPAPGWEAMLAGG